MVVPAFATSNGGAGVYSKPAVVIDTVKLLDGAYSGSVIDWPNNYFAEGGKSVFVNDEFVGFDCSGASDTLVTVFYPGSAGSFSLRCSNVFYTDSLSFSLQNDGYDTFSVTRVQIRGFVTELSVINSTYTLSSNYFSGTFSVNSSSVDLAQLIRSAVGSLDGMGDTAWLQDVQITIDYYRTDPDASPAMRFDVNQVPDYNPFVSWFDDADLTYKTVVQENVVMPGAFDWLIDSVDAFLDLEIVPGISLNALFYVALVIIVLIAFIKLLS
jgi:hypothetical protein